LVPPRHFALVGRLDLERRGAVPHGIVIDPGDRGEVARLGGTNGNGGHGPNDRVAEAAAEYSVLRSAVRQASSEREVSPAYRPGAGIPIFRAVAQRRSPRKRSRNRNRLMKSR